MSSIAEEIGIPHRMEAARLVAERMRTLGIQFGSPEYRELLVETCIVVGLSKGDILHVSSRVAVMTRLVSSGLIKRGQAKLVNRFEQLCKEFAQTGDHVVFGKMEVLQEVINTLGVVEVGLELDRVFKENYEAMKEVIKS